MGTKFRIKPIISIIFFLLSDTFSFGQIVTIPLTEAIDSSSLVMIGQVVAESKLCITGVDSVNVSPGLYSLIAELDAEVYSVSIVRLLKGQYSGSTVEILKPKGSDDPPYFLHRSKRYLLFLDTARVDSGMMIKYNLKGRNFFTPFFNGLGVTELNDQVGINELRRTEQYLSLSPTPIEIIALFGWIDSLNVSVRQAYNNKGIGDAVFVEELNNKINNARNFLLQGDSINCAKEILKFYNMVEGAYGGFDRRNRFVTHDWYSILMSDALYIRFNLPRIPDGSIPNVGSLNPNKIYTGGTGFTLTITGEDFENGSIVNWNWSPRTTTFVSTTQLQANITSVDIAKPDTTTVAVENPNGATHGAEFIVLQLSSGCNVKLVNSAGTKLTGGALQYYDAAWKDAVNNNDGTFSVTTNLKTISLRMTYAYGTQTKSNVSISNDTVVFQTVNAQIQLQNSSGVLIDTGSVQYYAGAWRSFGTTANGIANKELLPANYSFRMSYAYASKDKQQDIGTNATVVFQTVNAAVQLQNSQGTLIDQGIVQYYSGAWRTFGTTNNGTANKELLPNNYSFRMNYAYASKDKQQDISTNATVVFQTVNAAVQLRNSLGTLIDQGTVQYYSGAWRTLGTTTNGIATKELLPANYSFRMSYAYASKDKQQDISTNPVVVFQTVNANVQLKNSQGDLIDQGTVQYYSGAWRTFGTTNNGTANKELLPNNYSFRMTHQFISLDKAQDISTNSTINFLTVLCKVKIKNTAGQLIDNALASYYSGAWRQIGNTVNGEIVKELLPVNLTFRVNYNGKQQDKAQNISTNNVVEFVVQ